MSADVTAVVPAAGRGTRFGADRNKALVSLLGRPILRVTLDALAVCDEISDLVIAVHPDDKHEVERICEGLAKPWLLADGGKTRQESVRNALALVESPIVAVHDAARPLVTPDIVSRCIASAREHGSGIAAVPVADTLQRADTEGVVLDSVPREDLWAMQTPQCAQTTLLRNAFDLAERNGWTFTDEGSLLRNAGHTPRLARGAAYNMKVTTQEDLTLAEAILQSRSAPKPPRVGYGYDIHRFMEGRRMILGGVDFGLDYGPDGHSDADVILHAVMDALLGAAGLPDIGNLFPNTDERWRGASSTELLADVVYRIHENDWRVGNVDVTVIAERPKISDRVPEMRARISEVLEVPENAVGIKATTAEGLGDLGRGDGIAAHTVCMLV
jgi:2-C-methyl-D-erythritol 4-phosphate cytidylyltransferase/2-C-methyl-D-erythritol 2,4-cyclodiphosphate synthase